MYGKSNMETYITMCKIDTQWEFAVWLRTEALYQPRGVGWGRRWEVVSKGRGYMYMLWLIHVEFSQKTAKFCKAIVLQYKIN